MIQYLRKALSVLAMAVPATLVPCVSWSVPTLVNADSTKFHSSVTGSATTGSRTQASYTSNPTGSLYGFGLSHNISTVSPIVVGTNAASSKAYWASSASRTVTRGLVTIPVIKRNLSLTMANPASGTAGTSSLTNSGTTTDAIYAVPKSSAAHYFDVSLTTAAGTSGLTQQTLPGTTGTATTSYVGNYGTPLILVSATTTSAPSSISYNFSSDAGSFNTAAGAKTNTDTGNHIYYNSLFIPKLTGTAPVESTNINRSYFLLNMNPVPSTTKLRLHLLNSGTTANTVIFTIRAISPSAVKNYCTSTSPFNYFSAFSSDCSYSRLVESSGTSGTGAGQLYSTRTRALFSDFIDTTADDVVTIRLNIS